MDHEWTDYDRRAWFAVPWRRRCRWCGRLHADVSGAGDAGTQAFTRWVFCLACWPEFAAAGGGRGAKVLSSWELLAMD